MNHLEFEKTDTLQKIENLRNQYLDELFEAQELYLELMVRNGQPYLIKLNSNPIGYFVLIDKTTLLEYYLEPAYINQADTVFGRILEKFQVKMAFCKSFDHTLLVCCATYQAKASAGGVLFREQVEKPAPNIAKGVDIRLASSADIPTIAAVNEEVFEQFEEIVEWVSRQLVFLFEQDKALVGFGIYTPVIKGRPECDIGMLVTESYRGQGYGTYIIRTMANYCREHGYRPICGCDIQNVASRRCLEKAGFVSRYRLLVFEF